MEKPASICIITTAHDPDDDRIFHKQALSLSTAGFAVSLVGHWTAEMDSGPIQKVTLAKSSCRLQRFFLTPLRAFCAALKQNADAYHFHDPELLPIGALLAMCGKRVIYDVHEDYARKLQSRDLPAVLRPIAPRLMRFLETLCACFFTRIITADSHVASLFNPKKTTVIANYPPVAFVTQDPALTNRPAGLFQLAYVGGISTTRGINQILAAIDLLKNPRVRLQIAGDIKDAELEQRLTTHPNVHYHGVLPWKDVRGVLAQCDVGLLVLQPTPALPYHPGENIIKLWEYLGFGLPVIISDTKKLRALIESLNAGIAVDPTDPKAIAQAIQCLMDDPQRCKALGEHGRQAVLQQRNWEAEAAKLVALYRALLPQHGDR